MKHPFTDRIKQVLKWRWCPLTAVLLGALLVMPSLDTGLALDDYIHQFFFDKNAKFKDIKPNALDIFTFSSGEPKQLRKLMEEGIFPWWTVEDMKASFFRPLSSLSHLADHLLWPNNSKLKHLHSILWFVLLLYLSWLLYRRFNAQWLAVLPLLLFAVDDAHGLTVAFIANRNAVIAAVFGVGALLCHHRFRNEKWQPGRFIGPFLLAMGLLAGEACLAISGYLLAHAIFIDQGSIRQRISGLLPYLFIGIVWAVLYLSLGYGVRGSGMYQNPISEFTSFLQVVWYRFPVLLLGLLGFPPSDFWHLYPQQLPQLMLIFALLFIAILAFIWRPLLRLEPIARFWALGTLLAIIPVCATFTSDRNLLIPGLGAMGLLGIFMGSFLNDNQAKQYWRKDRKGYLLVRVTLIILILVHLVLAPLFLPFRSLTWQRAMAGIHQINDSIPKSDAIAGKRLVIVNPLVDMLYVYIPFIRRVKGEERPKTLRLLVSGKDRISVTRLDQYTLEIKPDEAFLSNKWERMFRGPNRPMKKGYTVTLSDMEVRITEVTSDGRAAVARFRFTLPLEDSSFLWMCCRDGLAPAPYSPPKIGETHRLKIKINLLGGNINEKVSDNI